MNPPPGCLLSFRPGSMANSSSGIKLAVQALVVVVPLIAFTIWVKDLGVDFPPSKEGKRRVDSS